MKRILPCFFCLLLLLAVLPADAARFIEKEMRCPLCGHGFYPRLDVPDPDYGMRLDLKTLGAIPGPWRLPVCHRCGFVIYSACLEKRELSAAAAAPAYVKSAGRTPYYRPAVLYVLPGKPDFLLASAFRFGVG